MTITKKNPSSDQYSRKQLVGMIARLRGALYSYRFEEPEPTEQVERLLQQTLFDAADSDSAPDANGDLWFDKSWEDGPDGNPEAADPAPASALESEPAAPDQGDAGRFGWPLPKLPAPVDAPFTEPAQCLCGAGEAPSVHIYRCKHKSRSYVICGDCGAKGPEEEAPTAAEARSGAVACWNRMMLPRPAAEMHGAEWNCGDVLLCAVYWTGEPGEYSAQCELCGSQSGDCATASKAHARRRRPGLPKTFRKQATALRAAERKLASLTASLHALGVPRG